MNNLVHVFEGKGLGPAPYRLARVAYSQAGTHCDYCGTAIRNVFWVEAANHTTFKVGCDCIAKTQDTHLIRVVDVEKRRHAAEMRKVKAAVILADLRVMRDNPDTETQLSALLHPKGYVRFDSHNRDENGRVTRIPLTGWDYFKWMFKYSGAAGHATLHKWAKQNLK